MTRKVRKAPVKMQSATVPAPLGLRFRTLRTALLTCTALCTVTMVPMRPAKALPQNGQVVSGQAQIVVKSPSEIDVIQSSNRVVINWSSFNIAAGEKVLFIQGNNAAQALNQILGGGASKILGQLQANGMVILSNPNGILIDKGADVRVGAIVATTAQMSAAAQAAFMAGGKANFDIASASPTASVVNRGTVTAAEAGLVGLVAPGVENSGIIQARLGTVQLTAGNTFSIDLYGDKLIKLAPGDKVLSRVTTADGTPLKALIDNSGTVSADGCSVILTANAAKAIVTNVINMDGIVQVRSVGTQNGQIVLDGGESGTVQVAGALDASGRNAGESGGAISVKGDTVQLAPTALADAGGAAGGGSVAVGTWASATTDLAAGSRVDASATDSGNGGRVTVLGGATTVKGTITARGGANGGDGGMVETSGHSLDIGGIRVDAGTAKGKAGNWLLDPTDLTVDASAATSIATALANNGVTLQTSATGASGYGTANSSGSGDIVINSAITWSANTALTLDAYRSVQVNANITASGNGAGLNVTTNHGGSGGNLLTGTGASVTLSGTAPSLAINGQAYTLLKTASDVQSMGTSGYYALAGDLSLASISNFVPIGTSDGTNFSGTLEGLGHTADGMAITASGGNNLGLFYGVDTAGTVRNLGLTNVNISAGDGAHAVGALAGGSSGTVINTYASGSVTAGTDAQQTAGLLGWLDGTLTSSHFTGTVTVGNRTALDPAWGTVDIGGLIGWAGGTITNSYASATLNVGNTANHVGGLTGDNWGTISSSHFTGTTAVGTGTTMVGGLTGENHSGSQINSSYASGAVSAGSGSDAVGGLVGYNNADLSSNYASAAVNVTGSGTAIGGLIGRNESVTLSSSYATGDVSGGASSSKIGGLVGENLGGTVNTSYATGAVSGGTSAAKIGGLVGENSSGAVIATSYALGAVTGSGATEKGLLVGSNAGSVTSGAWDTANTGTGYGTNTGTFSGTGLTTTDMKSYASFSSWGSAISNSGGSSAAWRIYDGYSRPLLRAFLTPLTVTATGGTRTYDGTTGGLGVTYSTTPDATLLGTVTATTSAKDVGNYTVTPSGLYSTSQTGYDVSYASGSVGITAKSLTVSGLSAPSGKVYDGTTSATVSGTPALLSAETVGVGTASDGKPYTGDTVNIVGTATGTYDSKNVASASAVTFGGLTSSNPNYVLALGSQAATISRASLAVSANDASGTVGTLPAFTLGYAGWGTGDGVSSLTTAPTVTTTATTSSPAGSYSLTPTGGVAANYTFNYVNGTLTLNNPANVTTPTTNTVNIVTNNQVATITRNIAGQGGGGGRLQSLPLPGGGAANGPLITVLPPSGNPMATPSPSGGPAPSQIDGEAPGPLPASPSNFPASTGLPDEGNGKGNT